MKLITRSFLAILGSTSALSAATFFTEDFSSLTDGPNLALGTGSGSPTTSFSGGNFTITSGINSRIYLGTTDFNYSTVDFTFQATVFVPNNNAWAIAFLGMGNPNATGASGEPGGTNLMMALRNDVNRLESRDNGAIASQPNIASPVGGTHLLRMIWTASTQSARFEYDALNDGSVDNFFTFSGADNGFNASNSQLVLGGGNGLVFDDVSVTAVPEPSTYGLIGAGALAGITAVRRRRKLAGKAA